MRTIVAAVAAVAVLLIAAPAQAHVRVDSGEAPGQGGYGAVRLTVPTESEKASTVGLTVTIPDDVTLTSAKVLPLAGWTAEVEKSGERVTRIVWQTTGPGLGPDEFGWFTFSAGPWPTDKSAVPLPSVQHYSDGSAVEWDEVALDASEPEHPAPIVVLGASSGGHHGAAAAPAPAPAPAPVSQNSGTQVTQWVLIGIALVLSIAATLRRVR